MSQVSAMKLIHSLIQNVIVDTGVGSRRNGGVLCRYVTASHTLQLSVNEKTLHVWDEDL
jgi:hypothetical protein